MEPIPWSILTMTVSCGLFGLRHFFSLLGGVRKSRIGYAAGDLGKAADSISLGNVGVNGFGI